MRMATETKRQNAGNKVAVVLPTQPSAPSSVSLDVALKNAIGARIRITTSAPTSATFEGTLFTADPITNLIAVQTSTTTAPPNFPSGSYRILPITQISSFQLLALPSPTTPAPQITPLDTTALQARAQSNIAKLQQQFSRLGPRGTSPETQAIFDGLGRTYPIKWHGTNMLISDSMVIEKPYMPANCRLVDGVKGRPGEVERIRKVLDMERQKVKLRGGLDSSANMKVDESAVLRSNADVAVRKGG